MQVLPIVKAFATYREIYKRLLCDILCINKYDKNIKCVLM